VTLVSRVRCDHRSTREQKEWVVLGRGCAIGLALVLALAVSLPAQDLAAAAEREKERRSHQKDSDATRRYSDADLQKGGNSAASKSPEAPQQSAAATPASAPPGGGEAYWRSRAASARTSVATAERDLARAEQAAGSIGPALAPAAPPCQAGAIPRYGESVEEFRRRAARTVTCDGEQLRLMDAQKASERVEAARQALATAQQAFANLEEEARRAGALPGWIR
jgi:hypothetical protein